MHLFFPIPSLSLLLEVLVLLMPFGDDDTNIEDGEDVVDSDLEETRDEIDEATNPFLPGHNPPPSNVGANRGARPQRMNPGALYTATGGFMPSFPAGKLPFIVCALVASASLVAIIMVFVWSSQVRRFTWPGGTSSPMSHRFLCLRRATSSPMSLKMRRTLMWPLEMNRATTDESRRNALHATCVGAAAQQLGSFDGKKGI